MTTVIERHRAPRPPGRLHRLMRTWWAVAAVAVFMAVLFGAWLAGQLQKDSAAAQLEQQTATTQEDLEQVSDPLAQLCATNEAARAVAGTDACQTAARVVQVPGPEGAPGAQGEPGRGIVSTSIDDAGHLLVTYSDGAQIDVGRVAGSDGMMGQPGRGITAANIASGRLVLAFSDGTSQDVGPIVGERGVDGSNGVDGIRGDKGEQGRGIASTEIVDERLVITYTDGTTEDAGPVPAGAQGAEGPAGPAAELPTSYTENFSDGSSRTCTRSAGDTDDANPSYDCDGGPLPEPSADPEPAPEQGTETGE